MIYSSKDMESRAVLDTVAKVCAAARTAPKTRGMDGLVTCVLTGDEKTQLAAHMRKLADELKYAFLAATQTTSTQPTPLCFLEWKKCGVDLTQAVSTVILKAAPTVQSKMVCARGTPLTSASPLVPLSLPQLMRV